MAGRRRCKAGRILVAHMHVRRTGKRLVDARHKRLHARVCPRRKNMRLIWNDGKLNSIVRCKPRADLAVYERHGMVHEL